MKRKPLKLLRVEGDIAFIPLTSNFETIIDADDAELVCNNNWHALVQSRTVYACRWDTPTTKHKILLLHRVLMQAPNDRLVDHIDGDGLNNRRCNLRLATNKQNQHNSRISTANTSGFKGVSWNKGTKKWESKIHVNDRNLHLGVFDKKEDAHAAYVNACTKYRGDFARVS